MATPQTAPTPPGRTDATARLNLWPWAGPWCRWWARTKALASASPTGTTASRVRRRPSPPGGGADGLIVLPPGASEGQRPRDALFRGVQGADGVGLVAELGQ